MDLALPLYHNVLVEREGFALFSDIEYENMPEFCSNYKRMGHVVQACKLLRNIPSVLKPQGGQNPKPSTKIPDSKVRVVV